MTKTKKNQTEQQAAQPDYVADLLKNGTTTLTAQTREELGDMLDQLPADVRVGAGAVGRNSETGAFTLLIHLIKNKEDNGNT
jgi:hypothetical protein